VRTDLCTLIDEVLPLYTEGQLAAETRRLVDQHAAECPACRERLERAAATLAPPPGAATVREQRGRQLSARARRMLMYGLVGIVVLMIGAGGWRYAAARKSPSQLDGIPARVSSAEQLAARAIPGWNRAKAAGLVVDLGISEKIAGTDATITLEKGWYSGQQGYILYTVKAPKGGYLLPTQVVLQTEDVRTPWVFGRTEWTQLSQWGGFSSDGFHGVLLLPQFIPPASVRQLHLTVHQWGPVTPEGGMDQSQSQSVGGQVTFELPWRAAYLEEPPPAVVRWTRQNTWLGRTLAVEELEVGIGRTVLTGQITLAPGEGKPLLRASLRMGTRTLNLTSFNAIPAADQGRYHFTATFEGLDRWPAPVTVDLSGIYFETDKTLAWPVNWAKYRDRTGTQDGLMDPADRVAIRFYDSELTSIVTNSSSISIEEKQLTAAPPYVRAALYGSGRSSVPDSAGMDLLNAEGEAQTDFGGGGGNIYDDPVTGEGRQGVVAIWGDTLPQSFRQSDRLTLRYVHPAASLVLNEMWELRAAK
jgi:hypothetical protein